MIGLLDRGAVAHHLRVVKLTLLVDNELLKIVNGLFALVAPLSHALSGEDRLQISCAVLVAVKHLKFERVHDWGRLRA